jgi:hypothetical protein
MAKSTGASTQLESSWLRVYAAGVQLAYRDTDRARLPLQYVEVVFEGVRQCTVLCADQQQHQQQIGGREP